MTNANRPASPEMPSGLAPYLQQKIKSGRKILSIYLPAGYPDQAATLPLLRCIVAAGADLIELGVPFSDPLADGPTIQAASTAALQAGITLPKTLELLRNFRRESDIPVLLMGYANPFFHYGWEAICRDAAAAGACGFIIPDLPLEESAGLDEPASRCGLDQIYLVSPNTTITRIAAIRERSRGFIYAVSLTGVTGTRDRFPETTLPFLQRLRGQTDLPMLVGFGISNARSAALAAEYADGVIIGSAVINRIGQSSSLEEACEAVGQFVNSIRIAL